LTGKASRSGERDYNRKLSLERVLRVKKYLRMGGLTEAHVPGPEIQAAGSDLSHSESKEDEFDRAVRIELAAGLMTKPLQRPTTQLPPVYIGPDQPIIMPGFIPLPDVPLSREPADDPNDPKPKKMFLIRHLAGVSATFGPGKMSNPSGVGVGVG